MPIALIANTQAIEPQPSMSSPNVNGLLVAPSRLPSQSDQLASRLPSPGSRRKFVVFFSPLLSERHIGSAILTKQEYMLAAGNSSRAKPTTINPADFQALLASACDLQNPLESCHEHGRVIEICAKGSGISLLTGMGQICVFLIGHSGCPEIPRMSEWSSLSTMASRRSPSAQPDRHIPTGASQSEHRSRGFFST